MENQGFVYAGFWNRVIACIIDNIILIVAGLLIGAVIGFFIGLIMVLMGASTSNIESAATSIGNILGIVIVWLYYAKMETSEKKATFGKLALGLRVVNTRGGTLSFGQATGRHFAKYLSALIFCIGFFMAGFTARKQGLHDILSDALVIKS